MTQTKNLLEKIYSLSKMGIKLGLHNMEKGLCALDINKNIARVIHIAGTNGKGSTCKILQNLIMNSLPSKKVGLYTSPHLIDYRERIQINNKKISEEELLDSAEFIFDKCKNIPLTFFEFTTLLCFLHFQRNKIDFAVIETGMGGKLDATNVLESELCLITSIALDHAEHLGDTINKIAIEKAGIFKKGSTAVLQKTNCMDILKEEAKKAKVLNIIEEGKDYFYEINNDQTFNFTYNKNNSQKIKYSHLPLSLRGEYQYKNASMALLAISELNIETSEGIIKETLRSIKWPGRLEKLELKKRTVYLDVSHNPEGIQKTIDYLNKTYPHKKIYTACGFMKDKEYRKMIKMLCKISQKVLLMPTKTEDRSINIKDYIDILDTDCDNTYICKDYEEAINIALNDTELDSVILFTGSLFNYEHISKILRPLI
jgi:dihydrofolate synthase / folylpolyglutamate synthase